MAISPYFIAGNLNFGSVPGLMDYEGAYANALSLNQQNYSNILAGYQRLMQGQMAAQGGIQSGYSTLSTQVLQDIANVGASQQQAINDAYAHQQGASQQSLIARGLGNTTIQNSVQRGLTLDKQKADIALANQMAQLRAGYRSNLGLAGLNYANQANMQNTALGSQQLGWMNSVNSPYPNPEAYARMAMMRGATQAGARPGIGGFGGGFGQGGGRSNVPLIWPRYPQNQGGGYGSAGVNVPPVNQLRPLGYGGGMAQSPVYPGGGGSMNDPYQQDAFDYWAAGDKSLGNYGAGNYDSAYEQAGGMIGPSGPGQQGGYDYTALNPGVIQEGYNAMGGPAAFDVNSFIAGPQNFINQATHGTAQSHEPDWAELESPYQQFQGTPAGYGNDPLGELLGADYGYGGGDWGYWE